MERPTLNCPPSDRKLLKSLLMPYKGGCHGRTSIGPLGFDAFPFPWALGGNALHRAFTLGFCMFSFPRASSGTGQEKRGECGPLEAKKDGELPSKSFWS